ncbi:putative leucine-rich repeat-containing protein DDB_G0290503 isoform X2 [Halyomorpha halys]|nr:early endosome antigen 1-like isoform X2 [Halyomorpha halys]XP_014281070.1 early endosome antigen 1-like isoform X2 [Halyomorpha halys]XP_014281071.1 early endosome antigen 1-like isoform X2 [Halyomorpha halys]XP_014281072.1 early endosome antigen 1-like isoform X2 [Halyomorpha halys]
MDKNNMKSQNRSLSMTELLTALTHAQMEREATLDEFKKVSEKEKKRAEAAQTQLQSLEDELKKTKKHAEDLSRKQKELEISIEKERESHSSLMQKKEEENNEIISLMEEKITSLQKKVKTLEELNFEVSDELAVTKNRMKMSMGDKENLSKDLQNLKSVLVTTKEDLNQAVKNYEIAESELHMTKMQLLKENNINNRLLDELKRTKKDIDGYREEIDKLKKVRNSDITILSKQIKELTTFIKEKSKINNEDSFNEIRVNLSTILKENFVLNNKINDVYTVLTRGETPLISVSTQTNIGLMEMFSFENMDKEVSCLVMKLREELVSSKSDLIDIKQQNEALRGLVRELKEEKTQRDLIDEEENRVERLEEAVVYLKQMLKEDEKINNSDGPLIQTLEGMRKDLDKLKDHVIQTSSTEGIETPNIQFKLFPKPIKLLPPKKIKY